MRALICMTAIVGSLVGLTVANAYEIDYKFCMVTKCNGASSDCAQARQAAKNCDDAKASQRKADYEAKQREYMRQHQAELDAAKKIEEANKSLNPHN
jgi:uncharacterized protein YqfA (UPF0365 family)